MALSITQYTINNILPKGQYDMLIDTIRLERSPSSGNQYMEITFKTKSEHPQTVIERLHFTSPGAISRSVNFLHRLSGMEEIKVTPEKGSLGVNISLDHEDALFDIQDGFRKLCDAGNKLMVSIAVAEWHTEDGDVREQNELAGYMPIRWEPEFTPAPEGM